MRYGLKAAHRALRTIGFARRGITHARSFHWRTGIISSACSRLALDRGIELYILNRGRTSARPVPDGAKLLVGDIRRPETVSAAIGDLTFDAVVDWVAFTEEHVETDISLFSARTGQYIFISSASAYHKPVRTLPITESTPLSNPYWQYSRDKIACEERLMRAYRQDGFPITIVRPSHTYDKMTLPFRGRYTVVVEGCGEGCLLWFTATAPRDG